MGKLTASQRFGRCMLSPHMVKFKQTQRHDKLECCVTEKKVARKLKIVSFG